MSEEGVTSIEHQGFNIETNGPKKEAIESLGVEEKPKPKSATPPLKEPKTDEEKRSEAASELGKAGGKASAEARKIKPIPPRKSAAPEGDEKPAEEAAGQGEGAPGSGVSAKGEDTEAEGEAETPEQKAYREEGERRKRDARARVEEATRTAAQAKRERDEALASLNEVRERLARLEGGKPEGRQEQRQSSNAPDREPDLNEYDDLAAYVRDMQKYAIDQTVRQLREQAQVEQTVATQDRILTDHITKFRDRVHSFLGENQIDPEVLAPVAEALVPEFQLQQGQQAGPMNWIANELVFSPEQAPALMLHFVEHPEELQRIAALPNPRAVSRAMANLEARLEVAYSGSESSDSHDAKREKSKAPPPITPVQGSPYVAEGDGAPKPGEDFDSWWKRSGRKGVSLPR